MLKVNGAAQRNRHAANAWIAALCGDCGRMPEEAGLSPKTARQKKERERHPPLSFYSLSQPSLFQVRGPAMPSDARLLASWNAWTAAFVLAPKMPSTLPQS